MNPYTWPAAFRDAFLAWAFPSRPPKATCLPPLTEGRVDHITGPSRYPAPTDGLFVITDREHRALARRNGRRYPSDDAVIDAMLERAAQLKAAREAREVSS